MVYVKAVEVNLLPRIGALFIVRSPYGFPHDRRELLLRHGNVRAAEVQTSEFIIVHQITATLITMSVVRQFRIPPAAASGQRTLPNALNRNTASGMRRSGACKSQRTRTTRSPRPASYLPRAAISFWIWATAVSTFISSPFLP